MTFDITVVFEALIAVLCALVSGFVIPWLKTKISAEKREKISFWVESAVMAAEEASRSGLIEKNEKYQYVVDFLEGKGIVFDEAEVRVMIDGAVWSLINQFKDAA